MLQTVKLLPPREIGDNGQLSDQIRRIAENTQGTSGALIRVLQEAQGLFGYLPGPVMKAVSQELKVPLSEVYGIVSFYHFFSTVPKGKYVIQVCMGTSCYVKGSDKLLKAFKRDWKLEAGGITDDGRFSLETVYCLGACGMSPVISVAGNVHGKVKPSKLNDVLDLYV